jgi:hypothetical protein
MYGAMGAAGGLLAGALLMHEGHELRKSPFLPIHGLSIYLSVF